MQMARQLARTTTVVVVFGEHRVDPNAQRNSCDETRVPLWADIATMKLLLLL
jgi:hypothetical protein